MQGLIEGRIVHYVLPDGRYAGEHRPAIVVKVWRNADGSPPVNGCAQLEVFTDFSNDYIDGEGKHGHLWRTSVVYGENAPDGTYPPGSWHWIERA